MPKKRVKGNPSCSEEQYLKENLIQLANHHRKNCFNVDCGTSLFQVLKVACRAGLEFTNEEKVLFM